ncbi:Probable galacturan 1,4-alpha-galacturonidase SALK6 [Linum perenne]
MCIFGSKNITLNNLHITAPKDSPNTDGVHIGKSSQITVQNTIIGTGDDCVSIGDSVEQVTVTNVTCGPGHGISIGSLGKYPEEKPVTGVFVKNCTLADTDNGVRIKSWPDLNPIASKVKISDVFFKNIKGTSKNPEAMFMNCSQLFPCQNIQLTDIDLTYPKGVAKSKCFNVKPVVTGVCNPPPCTVTS